MYNQIHGILIEELIRGQFLIHRIWGMPTKPYITTLPILILGCTYFFQECSIASSIIKALLSTFYQHTEGYNKTFTLPWHKQQRALCTETKVGLGNHAPNVNLAGLWQSADHG